MFKSFDCVLPIKTYFGCNQTYFFTDSRLHSCDTLVVIKLICSQIRDYIHVMDLADGHVAALRKLFTAKNIGDLIHSFLHQYNMKQIILVSPF